MLNSASSSPGLSQWGMATSEQAQRTRMERRTHEGEK